MCSTPEVALDDDEEPRQPRLLDGQRPASPPPAVPIRGDDPPDPPDVTASPPQTTPLPVAGCFPVSPGGGTLGFGQLRWDGPEDSPVTLDGLAEAIDELAADSRDGTAPSQLEERIARLWAMVSDLDPELARRRAAYERTEAPDS